MFRLRRSSTVLGLAIAAASLAFNPLVARAVSPPTGSPATVKTINDTRNVGTAMFVWLRDQVEAHPVKHDRKQKVDDSSSKAVQMAEVPVITREELAKVLVPKYISEIPAEDGWGHPYEYRLETRNPEARRIMSIRSGGSDGRFAGDSYAVGAFSPTDETEDLVWADGYFVRWPQAPTPK